MKKQLHSPEIRKHAEEERLPLAEHLVRILVLALAVSYFYVIFN